MAAIPSLLQLLLLALSLGLFATTTRGGAVDLDDGSCVLSGPNATAVLDDIKANCSSIVVSNVSVPAGVTLDLRNLTPGTIVSGRPP